MNVNLRSDKISLQVEFGYGGIEEELWQAFRRTAVEPGQASSPELFSFADECLLCAQIVINVQDAPDMDDHDLLWDAPPLDGHTHGSPQPRVSAPPPPPEPRSAGLIYMHASPANIPAGETNIGVIIRSGMQGRGYAREAVQLVLRWAFEELKFHRVQAAVLDTPFKDKALRLFIGSGFAHEGMKRRAVYQPEGEGMAGVWKDVTYLAMLDTEWMLRSALARNGRVLDRPVVSVWDEMFARHSREREELVQWEEKHGRVRRSSSMETLREHVRSAEQDLAYLTDDAASSVGEPSLSGSLPPSPRPNLVVTWDESEEDADMADALSAHEVDQGWEQVVETSFAARRHRQETGNSLLQPSQRGPTLALPSIPSTRLSEGSPQSPLTIPSPSSTPPFSSSPSPVPSSPHNSWADSEDEDNWLQRGDPTPTNLPIQITTPHDPHPHVGPASLGTRSRSSSPSSSSTDSWSDAQSSLGASWDVIPNASDHSHIGHP